MGRRRKEKEKSKKTIYILIILIAFVIVLAMFNKTEVKTIADYMVNYARMELFGTGLESYQDNAREKMNFNYGWRFSKGEGKNNAESDLPEEQVVVIPNTNEEAIFSQTYTEGASGEIWENVSLPHTYNDTDTFDNFMESGQNGERSMYTGTSWYTKEFTIPAKYQGKKIYIEFEAARQAAKISLNGTLLEGTSENGFIPFGYDLTQHINYGGINKLTVQVDNSFPYVAEGTTSKLPWHDSHWQPSMGGLYRNSYLYIVEPVHLTLPLYSFLETQGTYIYTSNETETTANINIDAEVQNSSNENKNLKLVAYVKKADGDVALTIESENIQVSAGEKKQIKISDVLNNAKRWSDEYPYLYTVVCKIVDTDTNTVLDNNENPLGIRTFKFTNDYGAYLNGNYVKLQGWGQKPTNEWAGLGSAYPDWMQDYVMKKMKDAGGNFVRWGHCAGGPASINAADKYGIITLQPGVEAEGSYGDIKYTADSYKIRTEAFRDMVIYYRNNPSILLWEIGNQTIKDLSIANEITSYIQKYDYGNRTYQTPNEENDYTFNNTENMKNSGTWEDSISTSVRLAGTRQGDATMKPYVGVGVTTEGGMSMNNNSSGKKPEVEGEYNRLEARRGVWDLKTPGYKDFSNELGSTVTGGAATLYGVVTSEEFAKYQVKSYENMIGSIKHGGGANWIFSDSTSHGRVVSETSRVSGEVDATMLEKESYWVSKVMFENKAGSHIIGHWNYPENTTKDVFAAANGGDGFTATATLKVTDLSGEETTYTGQNIYGGLWQFTDVEYKEGTVLFETRDAHGNLVTSASKSSHGDPATMRITEVNVGQELYANGSDILLLDIEIVDSEGNRCETFDGVRDNISTNFYLNSQTQEENTDNICEWRGGYNSSIEDSTNNKYLKIESGITRVAIRTTMTAGEIALTAKTTVDGQELQATYVTNSTQIDNTNGYSRLENFMPEYNMDTLTDPGIGDGTKPTMKEQPVVESHTSALIEDFGYTGTRDPEPTTGNVLENGATLYNDTTIRFTSVPYKYQNAEYFKLPSADNATLALDLINFIPIQDIDVLAFRDPAVPKPAWLTSDFIKQPDIVTADNGVVYDVYKRTVKAGIRVTLGANGQDAAAGSQGWMNVIAVKETQKVNNETFFDERFEIVDIENSTDENREYQSSSNGWNLVTTGSGVFFSPEEKMGETSAKLVDNTKSAMGYIYKKFAEVGDKFKVTYKVNVTDIAGSNNYIRLFLNNGVPPSDVSDLSKVLNQTYLNNTDLISKSGNGTYNIKTGISNNNWHDIEFSFDMDNKIDGIYKYTVKIDGVSTGGKYSLNSNNNLTADHILVATGNAHENEIYISNIKIEPEANKAVTAIRVNGQEIAGFNTFTKHYMETVQGTQNTVTIEEGVEHLETTITYADDESYSDIIVKDTNKNTYEYRVYFKEAIVNKTELRSVISEIEAMNLDAYQVAEVNSLLALKDEAKVINQNPNVSIRQVNQIIEELREKIKTLILK